MGTKAQTLLETLDAFRFALSLSLFIKSLRQCPVFYMITFSLNYFNLKKRGYSMRFLVVFMLFSGAAYAQSSFETRTEFLSEQKNSITKYSLTENDDGYWDFTFDPNSCSPVGSGPINCTTAVPEVYAGILLTRVAGPSIPELTKFNIGDTGYQLQRSMGTSAGLFFRICDSNNTCTDLKAHTRLVPTET